MADRRIAAIESPKNAAPAAVAAVAAPVVAAAANLGKAAGDVVGRRRLYYPVWRPEGSLFTTALTVLFYTSITVFVLFLILTFIHFTIYPIFSFSPNDSGIIPVPTASDKQTAFTTVPAAADLSANFVDVLPCEYTVGLDLFCTGDFPLTTIPRVLLYRSSSGSVSMDLADTVQSFPTRFDGSNLIVYMDPVKNDLYVAVLTKPAAGAVTVETIGPVENIAQRQPVRVTVVFSQTFVEIYVNGKLELSQALKAEPKTLVAGANFYPTVRQVGTNAMIGNMTYWGRHLTAREIRAYEGGPVASSTFFTAPAKK